MNGEVLLAFSGDDLVYSETLGDWRTHNGTDYACTSGDSILAAAAGQVTACYSDALWGGVVEITDTPGPGLALLRGQRHGGGAGPDGDDRRPSGPCRCHPHRGG